MCTPVDIDCRCCSNCALCDANQKRRGASQHLDQRPVVHAGATALSSRWPPDSAEGSAGHSAECGTRNPVFRREGVLHRSAVQSSLTGILTRRYKIGALSVDTMDRRHLRPRRRSFTASTDHWNDRSEPAPTTSTPGGWTPDKRVLFLSDYRGVVARRDHP